GEVRLADILNNAGWEAYDGPATASSMMTGVLGTGPFDQAPRVYNSPEFTSVIAPIPGHPAPGAIIVAKNGGAELLYLLGQDPALVPGVVKVLQSRGEIGAVFVADRFGAIDGTMPLSTLQMSAKDGDDAAAVGAPDIVAFYQWDDGTAVTGLPGIE